MSPTKRFKTLCWVGIVLHVVAALSAIDPRMFDDSIFGQLFIALPVVACLFGIQMLSRPARLLFPFTFLLHAGYAVQPSWPRTVPGMVAFFISVVILVLIWKSPTKELFAAPDPDAPVL